MTIIKATPNYQKRTFTLRTSAGHKYRTEKFSKQEFEECLYNTTSDWEAYLRNSDSYHWVI